MTHTCLSVLYCHVVFNIKECWQFLKVVSVRSAVFAIYFFCVFNTILYNFPIKAIYFGLVARIRKSSLVPPPSFLNITKMLSG